MHEKLNRNKQYTQKIRKIRSSTVEPVLGTLINFMNMRKINSRGMKQANKHVMMVARCYNLKKYMKFGRKKPQIMAKEKLQDVQNALSNAILGSFLAPLRHLNFQVTF
jgi:hypothetical protein